MEGEITMPGFGRWSEDIRLEMLRSVVGKVNEPTQDDANVLLRTISALARHVVIHPKSVVPGLGTFEWTRHRKRLPSGKVRRCVNLNFTLARKELDIAREIYRTGKPRMRSALPDIRTAIEAMKRRKHK